MKLRGTLLLFVVISSSAGAAGCRKEEPGNVPKVGGPDAAAGAGGSAEKPDPKKPKLPWSTDFEASYATMQGAWLVTGFGSYDSVQAWNIEGHKVTVYDAKDKSEEQDELIFESPCDIRLQGAGWGGTFTRKADGTPYFSLGDGGFKIGENIVACMDPGVVWVTPSGCKAYKSTFREWEEVAGTCKVEDGYLHWTGADGEDDKLRFVDDATLMTEQLEDGKPEKQPDFAAAKAKADERYAKNQGAR